MFKNKIPGEENIYRFIYFLGFNILKNKKMHIKNCIRFFFQIKFGRAQKNYFIYNDSNILQSVKTGQQKNTNNLK